MSETFDHNGLPDDELLAAELALGVLEGAERATAERRATRDRGFARLVEDWEHRLAPWAAEIAEISPPPQVWERISSALPAQPSRAGLWHNLTFWRGASLAAGALAAACLAALLYFGVFIQQQ
ncbi:MAG: anti-sigma factor, partial [Pseudolabrys sp.]